MIHIFLQIIAFMRFRKSVKFRWIRGVNIYGLIVAPISEVIYVSLILEWAIIPFMGYRGSGSKQVSIAIGSMVSLYDAILCILMIIIMTNSIKKTTQLSGQKHWGSFIRGTSQMTVKTMALTSAGSWLLSTTLSPVLIVAKPIYQLFVLLFSLCW